MKKTFEEAIENVALDNAAFWAGDNSTYARIYRLALSCSILKEYSMIDKSEAYEIMMDIDAYKKARASVSTFSERFQAALSDCFKAIDQQAEKMIDDCFEAFPILEDTVKKIEKIQSEGVEELG